MNAGSIDSNTRVFIGRSPRVRQILDQIDRMSDQRWPVLILGETGTGKEVIARLIHRRGSQGPFVVIDCSAIPSQLMESELFGHAKGSFTGATNAKAGLLELAHGGTAFLDEIGELPLDMQAKLLRALQEKEFRPVGSTVARRSEFRIVAATNRDLANESDKGTFRRDLYYRLKVITLRLPPLRDRREDVPDLIRHFLSRYGHAQPLAPEVMDTLVAYSWPGNVRELENCIQHMVAVGASSELQLRDMPSTVLSSVHVGQSPLLGLAAAVAGSSPTNSADPFAGGENAAEPILPLPELEKREILRAIQYTKGDRTAAAALLQIGRTTLYRKLKDYGFEG